MKLLSYVLLTASLVSAVPAPAEDVPTLAALETQPVQVAITADGSKLFAVDPAEASIQVWNMATGDLIRIVPAPGAVGPVAILADGRLAVAVRKAVGPMLLGTPPRPEPMDSVNILSADGKPVGITLLFPDANLRRSITSLAVTPDGKKLIAGTYSLTRRTGRTDGEVLPLNNRLPAQYGEIAAWTLANPKRPAEWLARYEGSGIGRIATLGPEAGLATFSNGSVPPSLFTYQATAGTPLINIPNFGGRPIGGDQTAVPTALSPDGKWIAAATRDRLTVRPADSEAGSDSEKEILVRGPIRDVVSLTFLPGLPTRLAVATQSELRLVDPETRSVLSFPPRKNDQNFGSFIAAATNRLVMVGRDGRLEIIDAAKMQTVASIPAVRYEPVQLVASGNLILMKDLNGVVTLWSRQEKRALWSSLTRTDRDAVPTFSPDGKQVFLTSEWGVRVCLDAVTGKPSGDLRKKDIYSPAFFSPNGELSVRMAEKPRQFGEQPRQIEIVDAATGAVRHSIVLPPRFTPRLFAFSPDGKTLVALAHAGRGDQIIVLDTATGSLTRTVTLKSHGETLLFSPSGDALIITALSGRSSGVMTVPLASGGEPRMVEMPAVKPGVPLPRFAPMILHIAVSPDARIAALGKQDGSVAICDAATGTVLRELPAPQFAALYSSTGWGGRVEGVSALAFCADNTLAVSGGKRVRLFGVTTGQLQGTLRFVVTKSPVTPVITQQSRTQFLVTENPDTMSEWFWTTPEGKWDASAGVRSLVKRRTAAAELRPAHR